jgi:hypothetical protein
VLRTTVVLLAATLAVLHTGCTHSTSGAKSLATVRPANPLVTVTGTVRLYGGPVHLVHGQVNMPLDGAPGAGQRVTARGPDGTATGVTTGSEGRFALRLTPGTYVFSSCGPAERISVRPGTGQQVVLRCNVPSPSHRPDPNQDKPASSHNQGNPDVGAADLEPRLSPIWAVRVTDVLTPGSKPAVHAHDGKHPR